MDTKRLSMFLLAGLALPISQAAAEPFAFQGQLNDAGFPADGMYDLEFELFGLESGGTQVGSTVVIEDQIVVNGVFLVDLDFGDVFDGSERWIEMSVRNGDSMDVYTELSPRLKVGKSPQASYATKAGVADGLSEPFWTEAPGVLAFGEDEGQDQYFFNRNRDVNSTDVMVVHSAKAGLGGMTLSSWSNGMPYFGYATGGFMRAQTYYDPGTDAWVVNKGGDQLEIDSNNDVIVTNNLIVGGTITSLSEPEQTTQYKSYTPETLYTGLTGADHIFNVFAGSVGPVNSPLYVRADLDLPHGASITKITVQFVDQTTSTDIRVQLSQRDLGTMAFIVTNLRDSLGAMNGAVQTMVIEPSPSIVIDNTMYTYDLRFASSVGNWPSTGTMGVRSVLVEYNMD